MSDLDGEIWSMLSRTRQTKHELAFHLVSRYDTGRHWHYAYEALQSGGTFRRRQGGWGIHQTESEKMSARYIQMPAESWPQVEALVEVTRQLYELARRPGEASLTYAREGYEQYLAQRKQVYAEASGTRSMKESAVKQYDYRIEQCMEQGIDPIIAIYADSWHRFCYNKDLASSRKRRSYSIMA